MDLSAQYRSIADEIDEAMRRVIESASFILGAEVERFEEKFARYCGVRHAAGCANGTDAVELALRAAGVKAGDEVITVSHTFIGTTEGITSIGARPVFVDVLPDTLLIDPAAVERAITPRTRAILAVHLYGQTADMDLLAEVAREHDLKLVEDAAQAHGSKHRGRRAGSLGDVAAFSFYPGKNLGAYGDAGAVVTNDADAAAWIRKARNHGRSSKYEHEFEARNSRMDGLQGAVLSVKLKHLDAWNERRRVLASRYVQLLESIEGVTPVRVEPLNESSFHLFVVRSARRDELLSRLSEAGIEGGIHYPVPLHLQPAYGHLGMKQGSLPVTEQAASEVLSLPIYPEMDASVCERVAAVLARPAR